MSDAFLSNIVASTEKLRKMLEEFNKSANKYNLDMKKYTIALIVFAFLTLLATLANLYITYINILGNDKMGINNAIEQFFILALFAFMFLIWILFSGDNWKRIKGLLTWLKNELIQFLNGIK